MPLLTLFLLIGMCSCKKLIDQKKQNTIMDAITNGIWVVDYYLEGSNDISASFTGYEFQFKNDGTVTGTASGNSTAGTWSGNASNYSITSNFPSAIDPVKKLNGIWLIKDSYWDYVEAEMTTSSGKNILHLSKKP